MAFGTQDKDKNGVDDSDIMLWKQSKCMSMLIDQIRREQTKVFKALMKDGAKGHEKNAGLYNAYEKVLALIDDA